VPFLAATARSRPPRDLTICSARRRLVGYWLDWFVVFITLFVGWYVWSLVRYRGLRAPGKQLLGMTVVDERTGRPPSFRRRLLRSGAKWLLLSPGIVLVLKVLDGFDRAARAVDLLPDRYLTATHSTLAIMAQLIFLLATTCWLLRNSRRQQLWDLLAGTIVVRIPQPPLPTGEPPTGDGIGQRSVQSPGIISNSRTSPCLSSARHRPGGRGGQN
jgi:uncharacterized RDD family membrane protein YckC